MFPLEIGTYIQYVCIVLEIVYLFKNIIVHLQLMSLWIAFLGNFAHFVNYYTFHKKISL